MRKTDSMNSPLSATRRAGLDQKTNEPHSRRREKMLTPVLTTNKSLTAGEEKGSVLLMLKL